MLIVFPITDGEVSKAAQGMLATVVGSTKDIEEYARESGQSVRVGFGCHIGEVVYGNIGTQTRLNYRDGTGSQPCKPSGISDKSP